jgi:uncharacterized membrane protein
VIKFSELQRNTRPDAEERVRRVEILISNLLRAGVLFSLALVFIGTVLTFFHHPGYMTSSTDLERLTKPGAAVPHTVSEVMQGTFDLQGQAIVAMGLLLLIATPVLRVAVSIFAFVYQEDRTYTLITTLVLILLLLSFILGKVE